MIWCVEDDASIRDIEIYALQSTGFEAVGFEDGMCCWEALKKEIPDLIILDVMMPNMDGVTLLEKMKASSSFEKIPVIMATAKGTEYDKVKGLDNGADDYLVKPFGMMEMISRVKAVLRRYPTKKEEHVLKSEELILNMDSHMVFIEDKRIELTYKEFELLRLFLTKPGIVFTRDQLFNEIWGLDYCGETRTVDMHIRTLRQKLGASGSKIITVRNVGYRLEEKAEN